jgi:hypothetical protein
VISLEISGTKLADQVLPPRLVRELDWVEKFWPNTKRGKGNVYPKVQLYCLMGVATAWTVNEIYLHRVLSLIWILGLAHRLRWLFGVLSYHAWVKSIYSIARGTFPDHVSRRYFISSSQLLPTLRRMNVGLVPSYRIILGSVIWSTKW